MIKTKDLEKFAESLGDEVININSARFWLTARYYESQFDDFKYSATNFVFTEFGESIPIEYNYVKLQRDVIDSEENMPNIFKPYFKDPKYYSITGTNLAKLIRDFCYEEQQWTSDNVKPAAKPN